MDEDVLGSRIIDLKLVSSRESLLHSVIVPQGIDGINELWWHAIALDLCRTSHDKFPSTLILWVDGNLHHGDTFEQNAVHIGSAACAGESKAQGNTPHRLNSIREHNLLVAVSFFCIVRSVRTLVRSGH